MSDWADEAAKSFDGFTAGRVELLASIATALRKAKADGMREAARMAFMYMGCIGEDAAHAKQRGDMVAHITVSASKLTSTN